MVVRIHFSKIVELSTCLYLDIFFTIFIPAASINICSNQTIAVSTSETFESPGYPDGYKGPHTCTLNITVPQYSSVEFRVDGVYATPKASCYSDSPVNYLSFSISENVTIVCGGKTNNTLLKSFIAEDPQTQVSLQFGSAQHKFGNYKFRIRCFGKKHCTHILLSRLIVIPTYLF